MNTFCFCFVSLILSCVSLSGQILPANDGSRITTRVVRIYPHDSSVVKIYMLGAQYDAAKNFYPYFQLSKTTGYYESARPTLHVRRTAPVSSALSALLKKHYGAFITREFVLSEQNAHARHENLNIYRLYPFRLNSSGQIEELLDYEVRWQTQSVSVSNLRSRASFADASVLASGTWYKIGVTQTGLHRLSRNFFVSMGVRDIDPANIRIYGNGGKMVPERNSDARADDLTENPILVVDGGDGSFDNQDYVIFYATGPTEWRRSVSPKMKFRGITNLYTDTSFYYVSVDAGPGKRIQTKPSAAGSNIETSAYDFFAMHEQNLVNLPKSGREFLGESFDVVNAYRLNWNDGNFVAGDSITAFLSVAAFGYEPSLFTLSGNGINAQVTTGAIAESAYPPFAIEDSVTVSALNTNRGEIALTVSKPGSKTVGWLNRLVVNARRELVLGTKQFNFRDTRVTGPAMVCRYNIKTAGAANVQLWDVTDPLNPTVQESVTAGGLITFSSPADVLREYCVAPLTDVYAPVFVGKVPNQNLHAIQQADYLIVAHPIFINEAKRLAQFHQKQSGLSVEVVTVDQIYNEFGSGKPDPAAIRDFIRMVYSRNLGGRELRYVALMGDGSYNNKNRNLANNSALIPTYQSHESYTSTRSVTSDDFYALMDPNEGFFAESLGAVDIGIGRFPCRTVNEMRGILEKIENYYKKDENFSIHTGHELYNPLGESPLGDWRNWLLFVADDGDNALHMYQADSLARIMRGINPVFNIDKIMLDAYQRFSTPGGPRYPDASEDFLRRIKRGTLLFNYTGHGGEVGLTGERIIDIEIINNLDNFNKLPLFVTATCEFSRFDDPMRTSAGELSLLNPRGGAIALMTTSRLAYSHQNFLLNGELVNIMFRRNAKGEWPALGDVMRETKAKLGQASVYAHFVLLGDPALVLSYPEHRVMTTHINGRAVSESTTDTIAALAKVSVTGFVADNAGNKITSYNGVVYPTVFDKQQDVAGLINMPDNSMSDQDIIPFRFNLQKNILYRGKVEVRNGDFSFTFIVPKDVSFAAGPGKIAYYATNGQSDAAGAHLRVMAGGDSPHQIDDSKGPQISIFLNDRNFVTGGITNEEPVLYADLVDSSGINTVGSGLGHDLVAVLDDESSKPVILNDFYEANLNSYQSGRVRYPFNRLKNGPHTLTFRAWDIVNNSNSATIDFIVEESAELALKNVLNYPNPFTTRTEFMFQHNQACNPLKVVVQIYTVTGKLVKTISKQVSCSGLRPEGVEWDGRDDFGDRLGRGVYVYRLAILDINNKRAEKIEKLVILN